MMLTVINLPFPPSVNHLFATVGKRRIRSERYRQWANVAGWQLKEQRPKAIRGPVEITLRIEEKTDRKRDLSNLVKAVEDLLVEHRIIDGDDHRTVRRGVQEWDDTIKGCRVAIRSLEAA